MFVKGNSIDDLFNSANLGCLQISNWFQCNRLTINYDKSAFMLFFPTKDDEQFIKDNALTISIDNRLICRVTDNKFLGIFIDENLTFKRHINYVTCKVNSINSMLFKRREYLPASTRHNVYFGLIQSRIKYGIEVYASATWSSLQPLHTANNRALRTLQNLSRFSNVKQLYIKYNTLPLQLMYKFYLSKLIYKCLNNIYPVSNIMRSMFNLNVASHRFNTRLSGTNHLYIRSDTAFYKSSVFNSCLIWNNIPILIRNANSLNSFAKLYKSHLIETW